LPARPPTRDGTVDHSAFIRTHAEHRRLLAVLLCQPDSGVLREEDTRGRIRQTTAVIDPDCAPPALDLPPGDDLLVAYTRIFLGPGQIPAPPYGSVYLDGKGQVADSSTGDVRRFYGEDGLAVAEDAAELPDHAAIELEYSAYLLECAAEVGESGDGSRILERQEEFESRFVRTWLPELGRRIEDCGVHEFYAGVGMLLRRLPAVATGLREVG